MICIGKCYEKIILKDVKMHDTCEKKFVSSSQDTNDSLWNLNICIIKHIQTYTRFPIFKKCVQIFSIHHWNLRKTFSDH